MTLPLIILAIPAALGGFGFFAHRFLVLPNEKEKLMTVPIIGRVAGGNAASFRAEIKGSRGQSP